MRFENFDSDGAKTLSFRELQSELSMVGFTDGEKLEEMFKRVDADGNGTLDFAEFLALMYMFTVQERSLSALFRHPTNAEVIMKAFDMMETQMKTYDKDRSRRLSFNEVRIFPLSWSACM
jgi:Ca2+-binding EF-hand superfamily protein